MVRMHAHSHADLIPDQRHLSTKFWVAGRMSAWLPMIAVSWAHCLNQGVVMCKSVHRAVDRTYAHASDNRPRSWQPDQQWKWHGMTWNDVLLLKHFHLSIPVIADGFAFKKTLLDGVLRIGWVCLDRVWIQFLRWWRVHQCNFTDFIGVWSPLRCIVSSMLVLAWFLANIVPFFGAAVDLLGASVTPFHPWFTMTDSSEQQFDFKFTYLTHVTHP